MTVTTDNQLLISSNRKSALLEKPRIYNVDGTIRALRCKAIQQSPNKNTNGQIAEYIHADNERFERPHILSTYACTCPWASDQIEYSMKDEWAHLKECTVSASDLQVIIVLNQNSAFTAIKGTRRTEASYLLIPKPTTFSGFFVLDGKRLMTMYVKWNEQEAQRTYRHTLH